MQEALAGVVDPEIRRPVTELGMVDVLDVPTDDESAVRLELRLTITGCPAATRIERDTRDAIESVLGQRPYELVVGVMTPEQRREFQERVRGPGGARTHPFGRDSLTRVIAVTSGKGGVGKSTVTVNLAVALAARGLSVGIVDADVHGYSVPALMGLVGEHASSDSGALVPTRVGDLILPPIAHGVKVISIGMFLDDSDDGVVAWRGPMLHRTLEQFLRDVHFGDLDVLLVDLPPGTGDVAISLGQLLPGAEVVVVTTPQPAAADVAVRSGLVARRTGQRVVGVIETMSPAIGANGESFALFGSGGGARVAGRLSADVPEPVPLLAEVPLSESLREAGDRGTPSVLSAPDDPASRALQQAAERLATRPDPLVGRPLGIRVR
ncbi:Mrp/NBP35 family ATP-binding protein [Pseudoclavibacter chungangensis]|uniref:Iron-sulfur cluster carrier protein n=1 Tax=Pseudoclavibacter chungangensis TaxID=587635 RepID=A0A7J5BPR4_9MICO|nr:Mrp/NBP35 family ATP-binding protein [Pseudoclavibacter chungangensis]KAB1655131.1 Mrp/NBP35 family ATP-binding protein [Pseudoclavibacter chungangensis]